MTMKAEEEMLGFLTRKDNRSHVIEILRRGGAIEKHTLMQFWNDLERRVKEDTSAPISSDGPMNLILIADEDPWDYELDYIYHKLAKTDRERLDYSIFFFRGRATVELCYGVSWQNYFKDVPPKLKRLAAVLELAEKLEEMGFKKPRNGCPLAGWLPIYDGNRHDFLARVASGDAEPMLQEASANFCALVKRTRNLVISANQAIAAAIRK
jgi:hypothetical protein